MCAWARIETQEKTCQVGGKKKKRQLGKERLFFKVPSATKDGSGIKRN